MTMKKLIAIVREKECLRCGHRWLPRKLKRPATCPSCHSPLWDEIRPAKPKAAP